MKQLFAQFCLAGALAAALPPVPADLSLASAGDHRAQAEAHFLSGRMLEAEGKPREALDHYAAFLSAGGDAGVDVTLHIADMTLAYRDMDAALALLDGLVKSQPGSPVALINLSRFCQTHVDEKEGLGARALQSATEAVKQFPQSAEAYSQAVLEILLDPAARDRAASVIAGALQQDCPDPAFWLSTGRVAQAIWPLAEGEKRQESLKQINPFYKKAKDTALAAKDDARALEVADWYLFSNQLQASTEVCEALVKRDGNHDARKRLVRLYEATDRQADSQRALEDLVKAFPDDVEHRRLLASALLQKRDIEGATTQLEAALQYGGGALEDYMQICNLLRVGKDPKRLLGFTQRAGQLFQDVPGFPYYEGVAHSQLKQYADAVKSFEKCERLAKTKAPGLLDDAFLFAHGIALERSGHYDEAAEKFEKSIQKTPPEDPARAASTMNYLGFMWCDRGEHLEEAEQLIRKANQLQPDNSAIVDSLGWVLFRRGKFQDAIGELLRAEKLLKEIEPGDAEIFDHIAQTYEKLGQRMKAEEYWKRVLDLKPEEHELIDRAEKELGMKKPPPPKDDPPATPQKQP